MAEQLYNWQNMKLLLGLQQYLQGIAIKMSQSQAQSSVSISDAQQDPFREFFKPEDSQSYSYYSSEIPSEIPDSQDSQDSQDLQDWINAPATSRDDRIAI